MKIIVINPILFTHEKGVTTCNYYKRDDDL